MSTTPCPFPGLLPFQEKDAPFFFGRDRETAELLARLEQSRFLAVIGVSGSGKSSLVHAGLKPELRFGNPPWRIVEMKPGDGPRRRFQSVLETGLPGASWSELLGKSSYGLVDGVRGAKLDAGAKVLVIVDQFEEIFSYRKKGHAEAEEADLFVQQLLRASTEPGVPVYVLLTMRTDYLGHCALFRNLPEALNEGTYLAPRLTRHEQEEAIRSPLAVSGVEIEPEVVDLLLNEAEANRDELPVLQHLLKRLWEVRGAGSIRRENYQKTKGWTRAIAADAAGVLRRFSPMERRAVKLLFQRITEKGTGERPIRTPCSLAQLIELTRSLVTSERLLEMLEAFRACDLLVWENEDRIDIPHECLTWRWKKLADWIDEEDRDARRLAFIAESGRAGTPLAGSALEEARGLRRRIAGAWVGRYKLDATELTRWIDHSEREAARARRRTRNLVLGLGLATLLFLALGLWAWRQKSLAQEQSGLALARQLASRSDQVFGEDLLGLEKATLLAAQSMRQRPTFDGDRALRRELSLLPRTRSVLIHQGPIRKVAFSPDGKWVATGSDDKTARVMEAATGKEVSRLAHQYSVGAVDFSPDGKWVATGSSDGTARVMEVATGKEVSCLAHQGPISAVAFSPDGKWVATGSWDKTARVMEAATGKEVSRLAHQGPISAIAFSPDGKWVATGSEDWTARVMEAATGKEVSRLVHRNSVNAVAFSPDGKWVATGSEDNTARAMETATEKKVSPLPHQDQVNAVAFSPDGRWVATGSEDGTARVMEAATGKEVSRLAHQSNVYAVAFSPDGKWVATGSEDGIARVMEAATGKEVSRLPHQNLVQAVAFSSDGKRVATGSVDWTARVMEAATGKEVSRLPHQGPIDAVAFSPDGKWVATGSRDKTARVMEAATGKEASRLVHQALVRAVAFSPDGRWVVTGSADKTARVMDAATGQELHRIELPGIPWHVRFSRDGRWLEILHRASAGYDLIYARHPLDPQDLLRDACEKVTRNLTVAEWKQYAGPEIPYRRTCDNLPFPPDYHR